MSLDQHLYGHRPAKKQKREMALSDTLDFAAQLRTLMAQPAAATKKSCRRQQDPLDAVRVRGGKRRAEQEEKDDDHKDDVASARLRLKAPPPGSALDAAERDRIRRHLEAKARRYAALQRGDDVPREGDAAPLVDFDKKWAERKRAGDDPSGSDDNTSDSDNGHDSNDDPAVLVEYVDEFGRTRRITRARRDRLQRRRDRAARAARELEAMRARPPPPSANAPLLQGDVIQTEAVETAADRGSVPDRDDAGDTHYRADEDIRTRGAAFYAFAEDADTRTAQMDSLATERQRTEAARTATAAAATDRRRQLDDRRRQMDDRRAALAARRANRMADSFLDGLADDFLQAGPVQAKDQPSKDTADNT